LGTERCRVYEEDVFQSFTGGAIRPGGLELTDKAIKFCSFPAGSKILDVGCGSGITVEYLCEKYQLDAVGMDPSDVLLASGLKRNPALNLFKGYGENIPYPDQDLDAIITECSLSLMKDTDQVLKEFYRVLKREGMLIITDLYWKAHREKSSSQQIPVDCCINGAFYEEDLKRKLADTGFQVRLWQDHTDLYHSFIAQIIFYCGSMKAFWKEIYRQDEEKGRQIQKMTSKMKLGYFLLIAQKS
jgi:arsenite methyltransferase